MDIFRTFSKFPLKFLVNLPKIMTNKARPTPSEENHKQPIHHNAEWEKIKKKREMDAKKGVKLLNPSAEKASETLREGDE